MDAVYWIGQCSRETARLVQQYGYDGCHSLLWECGSGCCSDADRIKWVLRSGVRIRTNVFKSEFSCMINHHYSTDVDVYDTDVQVSISTYGTKLGCWKKRLVFVIKLKDLFRGGVTNDLWLWYVIVYYYRKSRLPKGP